MLTAQDGIIWHQSSEKASVYVYIGGGWWADGDQVCHLTAAAAATTPTDTHTGKGTGEGTKEGEKVDGKKTQKQDKATRLPRLDCDT